MEQYLRSIYQHHASNSDVLGILILEKTKPDSPITDNFDVVLLIIVQEAEKTWNVKHYEFADKTCALHIVTEELLMEWIDTSGYRNAVEWIIYGRIIFDRNEFFNNLKATLQSFPDDKRNLRKIMEFGKLIKSYNEAKELFEAGEYMDTNSKILYSLHYLARLAVIEKGYYPEVTVWSQVKQIDIEVYKLYEEFIESKEELKKRVQLMLIAMDYVIKARANMAVKHLLDMMHAKNEWYYGELKALPKLQPYSLDLSAIITYLVDKNMITNATEQTKGEGVYHRKYMVSK
ncbi:nucleotidyltransferase-like protein [Virgibacillus dokdonensis]|uniref:nucleotidyltransferase-like protein n=1 Tax=Virgibacillus dokdonensis TaxID=302167 RepID=UPI00098B081D|nr:nucleotidyltransferase-like protein [Virgibacillus dokdonensis]